MAYIEVGAECAVGDRRCFLVREQQHLGLGHVLLLEGVVVGGCDLNDSVADVLIAHLLELVSVQVLAWLAIIREDWSRNRRVNFIGRELCDAFFIADGLELVALHCANSKHHFVLEAELLVLSDVAFAGGVVVLVELDDRDSLLAIVRHLLLEILRVEDLDC